MIHEVPYFKPSTTPRVFTVISTIHGMLTHYDREPGTQCGGPNCRMCAEGWGSQWRWILRLETPEMHHYLLQLRERHRSVVELVAASQRHGMTRVIEVEKAGSYRNSPVQVRSLREISCSSLWEIAPLEAATFHPAPLIVPEAEFTRVAYDHSEIPDNPEQARLELQMRALRAKHAPDRLRESNSP